MRHLCAEASQTSLGREEASAQRGLSASLGRKEASAQRASPKAPAPREARSLSNLYIFSHGEHARARARVPTNCHTLNNSAQRGLFTHGLFPDWAQGTARCTRGVLHSYVAVLGQRGVPGVYKVVYTRGG